MGLGKFSAGMDGDQDGCCGEEVGTGDYVETFAGTGVGMGMTVVGTVGMGE